MNGILGKKLGMTNLFNAKGNFVPVTIIEAGPCHVVGIRTKQKEGYSAVLLGFEEIKDKHVANPQKKWFQKISVSPKRYVKEIRINEDPQHKIGDKVAVSAIFKKGDYVDVRGTTIGKGFQGGMKRWNWAGGEEGHGSMFHRAPGSIGASSFPSRVFKGQHLPGHMGAVKQTIQNLEVVDIDEEKNLLLVKGSVTGHDGTFLVIKQAKKKKSKKISGDETKAKKDENKK